MSKKFASQENDSPKYQARIYQARIYQVKIQGLKDKKLLKSFHDAVVLEQGPMSPLQFQEKLNLQTEKLTDLAHFYGYYDATVDYTLVGEKKYVIFCVTLGKQYILSAVELHLEDPETKNALSEIQEPKL